ncbi:MAG: hypothetical protein HY271_03905 [Deltaproteobacteria bacterium]|nr:hypothetical protein [Deltaproteobacteria bacterium]
MNSLPRFAGIGAALVAALALTTAAHAGDPLKCKKTIEANVSAYVQAKMKVLQKCHAGVVSGKTSGPCPDTNGALTIAKVETKIRAGIAKACGGSTKSCTDGDALALSAIGWNLGTCPNDENGCINALSNCNDISDCVVCVAGAAADQAMSLYYDDLAAGQFGTGTATNKCQLAMAKNAYSFLAVKNKVLTKCEAGVLTGAVVGPCPDATRALPAINAAESKKQIGICKACGGTDKACGGGDDLAPAAIGFATNCPSVKIPNGLACGGAITTVQDIVNCVDCVDEFNADCLDSLSVPALKAPYPAECNGRLPCAATPNGTPTPCPTATPGVVCPSQVVTEANGSAVDLDTGWTGQSHDAHAPSQNRLTLSISGCSNPDSSTCGVCTTSGPLPNAGGTTYNTERCVLDTSVQCTIDGNCSAIPRQCNNSSVCVSGSNDSTTCVSNSECPGGTCVPHTCTSDVDCPGGSCPASPCSFFFGSPLPLSAGGVSVCVTNQITAPITGTVDIEAGSTANVIQLLSRVHVGPTVDKPCPTCDSGVCHGGPHDTNACVVSGVSPLFGNVSFDCPPSPATDVGNLPISLAYSTGTQTLTLSASNPDCSASGYSGSKCFCDTCNDAAAEPCTSNADCVVFGATICGGKRCLGGPNAGVACTSNPDCPTTCNGGLNDGAACTVASQCPMGACPAACSLPGLRTKPNDCNGSTCSPVSTCVGGCNDFLTCNGAFHCVGGSNVDGLCTVDSECPGGTCDEQCPGGACVLANEGTCAGGPFELFCAIETFRGCATNADCPRVGDTCTFGKFRDCFTDNGALTGTVTATGVPYPTCGGTGTGTVGALFCVPPTSSGSVNSVSGLPGLGRVTLPYTATFNP